MLLCNLTTIGAMVLEKKSCLSLFKYVIFRHTKWSKITLVNRKWVTVTKLRYRFLLLFFFNSEYLCFIDIPCQNSAKKIQWVWRKKVILLFLLFLIMTASLDS